MAAVSLFLNTNMTAVTSVKMLSTCYLGLPVLPGRAPWGVPSRLAEFSVKCPFSVVS